ncbi:Abi family protein [Listeria booriae]|uniref:Abi family protein n=1 Tax=Listeria booriae TaxID=1552123 RepID=UPI0016249C82|nr:Abi family protein [Listeria booriae]MBC1983331.1 hypothetical protein [Listeria booriae]
MGSYTKPVLTYHDQAKLLEERGMLFENIEEATSFLKNVSYYRFSGYFFNFYEKGKMDVFSKGVSFERIKNIYLFDEELRILIFALLENIEVTYRARISHIHASKCGPLAYLRRENFEDGMKYDRWFSNFQKLIERGLRNKEGYVAHFVRKYDSVFPIWAALEMSDFTCLSMFYANLTGDLQTKISNNTCGVSRKYLKNWLLVCSVTRNCCAHNARLYGRTLSTNTLIESSKKQIINNYMIFSVIYICRKMCLDKPFWNRFLNGLVEIIDKYESNIDLYRLGFPDDWRELLES